MENIQINGQRIWGPPKDWLGPPPPHGTEVFIKNIPHDIFEDELYCRFSSVGKVYEVRLPVHWTGTNKGYAFVRFTKVTEADAAIEILNGWKIRKGKPIRVERSLDNTRLFLSSVPHDKSGEEIKSILSTVVENIKTVYVYPALENPTMFRGYAFVDFVCHRDAAIAKRILTSDVLINLFERRCIAAWANPLPFLNNETLKNIHILFMRNIPLQSKTISVKMAIDALIAPDSVHKLKRLNDYAFLIFKNHDMAERALLKIKCYPYLLGMKAVHVEWAIPKDLANSSPQSSDLGKDDELEQNFESLVDNCRSLYKIMEDYKAKAPQILIEDYNNLDVENIENIPFGCFPNGTTPRILQRQHSEFDSLSVFKKAETLINKTKPKFTLQQQQHKVIKPNDMSALILESIPNKQSISDQSNSSIGALTEFQYPDLEDSYRDVHLKNWLQSLSLTEQTCATSPTLTSSSTGSPTNMSWKWDETCGQTFPGGGQSLGYHTNGGNTKLSPNSTYQLPLI